MKSKLTAVLLGACGAMMLSGAVIAGDLKSRSADECYQDLMRTWKSGGGERVAVRTRAADDAHADLIRDWGAPASGQSGKIAQTRAPDDAYGDLIRASFAIARLKQ
jgi:hypothetical protein